MELRLGIIDTVRSSVIWRTAGRDPPLQLQLNIFLQTVDTVELNASKSFTKYLPVSF